MIDLFQAIPFSFGALFPVINPIGSAVIFLSLVEGLTTDEINRLAIKVAVFVTIMLLVVLIAGSWILKLFGITVPIVLIAGGLVLAYIGWQLLNKQQEDSPINLLQSNKQINEMAFYPLSMPVTAGPGCIAVVITIGAHSLDNTVEKTILSQIGYALGIILMGITIFFCYRYSLKITKKIGIAGTKVIMRLAAFINLCIGMQLIWHGIQLLFPNYFKI